MPKPVDETCENCLYMVVDKCARYAPMMAHCLYCNPQTIHCKAVWPRVELDDWRGDWKKA